MSSEVADQYDGPPVVSPNVLDLKSRDGINQAGFPYTSSLEDADGPKLDGISPAIYKSWEDESYGLHLRQSSVDGNDVVDVIAVHSLNGHPIKSFQDDNTGFNWLFQLQVDFRNVQVWSFKYRADVRVDNISLADVATQLRINIETKLQQGFMNNNPRIVFVGHGFGGTVIKKTLLDWNKLAGAENSLTRNVLGLIFCSTQHTGKFPGPLLNVLLASNITNRLTAWFQTEGNRLRYPMESLWFQTDLSTLAYQVESANRDFQNILEHFPRIVCLADNIGLGTTSSPPYADLALIPWRDGVRLDKTLLDTAKVSGRDDEVFRHIREKLSQWLQSPRPSAPRFLPVRSDEGGVRILTLVFEAEPLEQEVKKLVRNHLSPQERRLVYPNVSEATLLAPTDSGCRM
ncbi:hypothetical protein AnigIFM59636_007247 [Aspergillus niger]|nr:hypothetical protein AnigIFM59636_007247 [Aspergillus niger]